MKANPTHFPYEAHLTNPFKVSLAPAPIEVDVAK
jgi:hypothetical protein